MKQIRDAFEECRFERDIRCDRRTLLRDELERAASAEQDFVEAEIQTAADDTVKSEDEKVVPVESSSIRKSGSGDLELGFAPTKALKTKAWT